MFDPEVWMFFWLCLSALVGGAINAVAGGGTLLTFPALLSVVTPVMANGTSTVALMPGSLASAWGYRTEMKELPRWAALLIVPSFVGGTLGTLLVTRFPESTFKALVPWLILIASLLFLVQPLLSRWTGMGKTQSQIHIGARGGVVLFQFLVAVYGGYFGAGIGILMISSLSLMGLGELKHVNALKTFLAACINGVSVVVWILEGQVAWRYALAMALSAIAGGYLGARLGRRLPRGVVRWTVIALGFGLSGYYFYQNFSTSTP